MAWYYFVFMGIGIKIVPRANLACHNTANLWKVGGGIAAETMIGGGNHEIVLSSR
jgi:hypothetical protein